MLANLGKGEVSDADSDALSGARDITTLASPVPGVLLNATATGTVIVSVTLESA